VARAAADACRAYLAARLAVPGGALTAVEVRRLLLERGVNPSLAGDLARVFEVFEAAVFQPQAAASGAVSEAVARARELLPEVERALRRPALSREEA
jgi:uncharacterized protein with FMN-binding domain